MRSRAYNDIGGLSGDDALNQTTSRTTPFMLIHGMAPLEQSIAVDGSPAVSDANWWSGAPLQKSETDPQWQQAHDHR